MRRRLAVLFAASALLAVLAPPGRADGPARTAPFDVGTQCVSTDASGGTVSPIGIIREVPFACFPVSDPVAQATGLLQVGEVASTAGAHVVNAAMPVAAASGQATLGRRWAGAGITIRLTSATRLTVRAEVSGTASRLCLTVLVARDPDPLACKGVQTSATIDAQPNTNYTALLTLYDDAITPAPTLGPCLTAGPVSCRVAVGTGRASASVTLESISYSLG